MVSVTPDGGVVDGPPRLIPRVATFEGLLVRGVGHLETRRCGGGGGRVSRWWFWYVTDCKARLVAGAGNGSTQGERAVRRVEGGW